MAQRAVSIKGTGTCWTTRVNAIRIGLSNRGCIKYMVIE